MLGSLWIEIEGICVGGLWSAHAFVGLGGRGGSVLELHHSSIQLRWSGFFPQSPPFTGWSTRWKTRKPTSGCQGTSGPESCNGCDGIAGGGFRSSDSCRQGKYRVRRRKARIMYAQIIWKRWDGRRGGRVRGMKVTRAGGHGPVLLVGLFLI